MRNTPENQSWDITDDDTLGKYTEPDLLLFANGTLQEAQFPITSRSNTRKLNANSLTNRDRQLKIFIHYCATNGCKYGYFDVQFSLIQTIELWKSMNKSNETDI